MTFQVTRCTSVVVAIVAAAACTDPLVPLGESVIRHSYVVWQALAQFIPQAVPGMVYGSPSHNIYIDSGSAEFRGDRTATAGFYGRVVSNACYLNGGSCPTTLALKEEFAGPYSLTTTGVEIGGHLLTMAPLPDRISAKWAGPDSLSYATTAFCCSQQMVLYLRPKTAP